jgi:hypothetical protein
MTETADPPKPPPKLTLPKMLIPDPNLCNCLTETELAKQAKSNTERADESLAKVRIDNELPSVMKCTIEVLQLKKACALAPQPPKLIELESLENALKLIVEPRCANARILRPLPIFENPRKELLDPRVSQSITLTVKTEPHANLPNKLALDPPLIKHLTLIEDPS